MKGSTASIVAGALAFIAGLIALIFPLPASLAVTVFVGVAFLVAGALGLFAAFSDSEMPSRGWVMLFALMQLILGVWLLANPLAGLISLTIMAGALFFATGVLRLVWAFRLGVSAGQSFWVLILSALLSIGLGLYVLFFLPAASAILLGTLLAIELISVGVALIAMGVALKKLQ
ncbi:hypothetical protein HOY34_03690 [Xinfangfangia sp. D13-10-4-6]|uniref:HdeD family acid-resistance protein n=1 Tax=Pseudogemmobacter hezensis TaxID=2737662 RepID=UPI00155515E6|nr:DUF308 domain-containing protein [Pseudogemmobacter hezensis]NPD14301.1 hypothetical protein [Pseudogemmobacter hezensis]